MTGTRLAPHLIETALEMVDSDDRQSVVRGKAGILGHISALEEEINGLTKERDNHASSARAAQKRLDEAADELADVLPGEAGRLNLVARIQALKKERASLVARLNAEAKAVDERAHELARLKPTGQVADWVSSLEEFIGDGTDRGLPAGNTREALLGLSATAHGYEAAVAELADEKSLHEATHDELHTCEIERDSAVADNAALLLVLRDSVMAMNHACDTLNDMDACVMDEDAEAMAAVERVTTAMEQIDAVAHPGAALLERHAKDVDEARNQALEEAARMAGPDRILAERIRSLKR